MVPLNALIQFNAEDSDLGTILAGNNFLQNVFMLSFLCATVLASLTGLSSIPIILTLAAIMALGSVHTLRRLPQSFMRFLLRIVFAQRYRLAVSGLSHIPSQGGVLLLGNHTSWIDWAVLHLAVPRPVRFVMSRHYYNRWYLRWFLDLYRVIPISSAASSSALRKITEYLRAGECVVLFSRGGHQPQWPAWLIQARLLHSGDPERLPHRALLPAWSVGQQMVRRESAFPPQHQRRVHPGHQPLLRAAPALCGPSPAGQGCDTPSVHSSLAGVCQNPDIYFIEMAACGQTPSRSPGRGRFKRSAGYQHGALPGRTALFPATQCAARKGSGYSAATGSSGDNGQPGRAPGRKNHGQP